MTPIRQVVHVLWKDLREHRVRVFAFLLVVAAAALRAAGLPLPVPGIILAILVFLTGIAIVGAPMLAESPSNPLAAWASRPLAPRAVLGAKLAFALLLVAVAALAQWLALTTFDLTLSGSWRYVVTPAAWFGAVLLAALVVAAATTDERNHLLLVLALVVSVPALGQVIARWRVPGAIAAVGMWGVPLLMLGALVFLFRARRDGFVPIAVALVVVSLGALPLMKRPPGTLGLPAVDASVPRAALLLSVPEHEGVVREGAVRVRIGALRSPRGWQYSLRNPIVYATLRSGRTIRLEPNQILANIGGDPGPVPVPREASGGGPSMNVGPAWREVKIPVASVDVDAEGEAVVRATLEGEVIVTAIRPVDTMPLRQHAVHTRRGIRSRIDSLSTAGGRPSIRVHAEGITTPDDRPRLSAFASYFGRSYALLGSDGTPPVPLQQTWAASETMGLVLPTGSFGEVDLHLELFPAAVTTRAPRAPAPRLDEGWLRTARLLAVEPVPLGSYPVALEWRRGG